MISAAHSTHEGTFQRNITYTANFHHKLQVPIIDEIFQKIVILYYYQIIIFEYVMNFQNIFLECFIMILFLVSF